MNIEIISTMSPVQLEFQINNRIKELEPDNEILDIEIKFFNLKEFNEKIKECFVGHEILVAQCHAIIKYQKTLTKRIKEL